MVKVTHNDQWRSMKGKTIEVIHIGDKFYFRSGTSMSSIYMVVANGLYTRFDWGFVQVALEAGNRVNIRPATDHEMVEFQKILDAEEDVIRRRKARQASNQT